MGKALTQKEKINSLIEEFCFKPMQLISQHLGDPVNLSEEDYRKKLHELKTKTKDTGEFHLVVNLKTQQLDFSHGVNQVLGYSDDDLNFRNFLKLIHPDYLQTFLAFAMTAYQLAIQLKDLIIPLQQTYRVGIPLLNRDNYYYWYNQKCTAIRLDRQNYMVCHLNTYQYVGPWSKHSLRPFEACLAHQEEPRKEWDSAFFGLLSQYISAFFSPSEILIMRLYAEGHSTKDIVDKKLLPHKKNTLYDYNKKLVEKANSLFNNNFINASHVASYFQTKGLLAEPTKEEIEGPHLINLLKELGISLPEKLYPS